MADQWADPPIDPSPDARGSAAGGRVVTQQSSGDEWPDPPIGPSQHAQQPQSFGGWPDPPVGEREPTGGKPGAAAPTGEGGKPSSPPVGGERKAAPVASEGAEKPPKGTQSPSSEGSITRGSAHATVQPELGETTDPWTRKNIDSKSLTQQALMPATEYWPTYVRMFNESLSDTSKAFNDLFHAKTWSARGGAALRTAASAVGTVSSPVNAVVETLFGGPIQGATEGMLPKDKSLSGLRLTSEGGGLDKGIVDTVGQAALPILSAKTAVGTALSAGANAARSAVSGIPESSFLVTARKYIAPGGLGIEAKESKQSISANWGELARRGDQARAKLDKFAGAMAKMPQSAQLDFIHRTESGMKQATPELQQVSDTFRQMLDEKWAEVHALGKIESYIQDYFPHYWKDAAGAASKVGQIAGRRPLQGAQEFRKIRSIPTMQDGMAIGLDPVTTNPVDLTLLKLKSMDRLIVGTHIVNELKNNGLLQFFKSGVPHGWKEIDDPLAQVKYTNPQGELVLAGKYAAPENAARVINNHLSSSALAGQDPIKWTRMAGNLMNMSQLSFSAFHAGFVTFDAMASRTSLAVEQAMHGEFGRAIKTYAGTFLAPASNLAKGNKIREAWLNPGGATPELRAMADALEQAGGRIKMDEFYQATPAGSYWKSLKNGTFTKEIKESFKDHPWKAPLEAVSRTVESSNSWLMEYYVPRVKLGVFHDMAADVLRRKPGMAPSELREALQKTWDSVDNRMGQLVYDNLMWNRTLRDSSHLAIRAVGWTLGTIREIGGGGVDLIKSVDKFLAGDGFDITHRTAYLAGITANTALISAITQYLYTGHGPTELKDYLFPRTGGKDPKYGFDERISLPTYMKDIAEYNQDLTGTLISKIHPLWRTIYEVKENRDFFGAAIVNRDDPWDKQLKDLSIYLKDQYTPFNWKGNSTKRRQPSGDYGRLEQMFGFQKAPLKISSPETAEKLEYKYDTKKALKKKAKEEASGDR